MKESSTCFKCYMLRCDSGCPNLVGAGGVDHVSVYAKEDLFITVMFFRGMGSVPRAGLVAYARKSPFSGYSSMGEMSKENVETILSTVNVRWDKDATSTNVLRGATAVDGNSFLASGRSVRVATPISTSPSITRENMDQLAKSVRGLIHYLYPYRFPEMPTPFAHVGAKLFAFREDRVVVICSSDNVTGLTRWLDFTTNKPITKPTPKKLMGI